MNKGQEISQVSNIVHVFDSTTIGFFNGPREHIELALSLVPVSVDFADQFVDDGW